MIDTEHRDAPICPTCGHENYDHIETFDELEGEFSYNCVSCGQLVKAAKHCTISFTTSLLNNPAPAVAQQRLVRWRDGKIAEAKERGDEFFMGLPDAWYEPPTWACINGHVSARYLKSETLGTVCLSCHEPLWLIPRITEADLAEILSANTETSREAGK